MTSGTTVLRSWRDLPDPDPALAPRIVRWYREKGRCFPWRGPTSPYHVLCAEMMLQRTRAAQVAPVWEDFRKLFGHPSEVVRAGQAAVAPFFARLGLLWRVKTFWAANVHLAERFGGDVPTQDAELRSLPGVGTYVSAAIRVFAFGEPLTVVDSNVLRIFGRYYGIAFTDAARRSPALLKWANRMAPLDPVECREYNWGLIDHGALLCTPVRPRRCECPLIPGCSAAAAGR